MAKLRKRVLRAMNAGLNRLNLEIREKTGTYVESHGLKFRAISEKARNRGLRMLSKEPSTIAWIDGFMPGDVFWDVGANVGAYTLYAAKRGCRVFAFEPAYFNFAVLNDNILANGFGELASACCVALNDRSELNTLNLSSTDAGSSLHSFANMITYTGESFAPQARQAVLGITLDDFAAVTGVRTPNYLKIDVDGNETKVLEGGPGLLKAPGLRSVMVELNVAWREQVEVAHRMLESAGLKLARHVPSNTENVENFFFERLGR
jgi:FkbM family methyltransferase